MVPLGTVFCSRGVLAFSWEGAGAALRNWCYLCNAAATCRTWLGPWAVGGSSPAPCRPHHSTDATHSRHCSRDTSTKLRTRRAGYACHAARDLEVTSCSAMRDTSSLEQLVLALGASRGLALAGCTYAVRNGTPLARDALRNQRNQRLRSTSSRRGPLSRETWLGAQGARLRDVALLPRSPCVPRTRPIHRDIRATRRHDVVPLWVFALTAHERRRLDRAISLICRRKLVHRLPRLRRIRRGGKIVFRP